MNRPARQCVALLALAATATSLVAQESALRLPLLLRKLDRTARVLYVTAHPDDEDNALLVKLSQGQGVEVALLTLTRGEGGQNEIGTELFHALGVLRARELEAVHRHDGVTQFFARAFEFGYSFSVEETFAKWGKDRILRDVVQVIRMFAPDVILTMSPHGGGGGQHHQASAQLAREAFDLAADPKVWPDLGPPHATRRLFHQARGEEAVALCEMSMSDFDPVLGATYAELGTRARGMHKCQGMTREAGIGGSTRLSRWEWVAAHGETPRPLRDLLEGLPERLLTGSNTPGYRSGPTGAHNQLGSKLRTLARDARSTCALDDLPRVQTLLLGIADVLGDRMPEGEMSWADAVARDTLAARLGEATMLASGVRISVRADRAFVAPGERVTLRVAVENHGRLPAAATLALRAPGAMAGPLLATGEVRPGGRVDLTWPLRVPADTEPTIVHPVPESAVIVPAPGDGAAPANGAARSDASFLFPDYSAFQVAGTLHVQGRSFALPEIPIEHVDVRREFPDLRATDLQVVPDPSVRPALPALALPCGGREVTVEGRFLVSSLRGGQVEVAFAASDGFQVEPKSVTVATRAGVEAPVTVRVTGRGDTLTIGSLRASARHRGGAAPDGTGGRSAGGRGGGARGARGGGGRPAGGGTAGEGTAGGNEPGARAASRRAPAARPASSHGFVAVDYPHIRRGALLCEAELRLVAFPCAVDARGPIGYVEGVGDEVAECLRFFGAPVKLLAREDLLSGDLSAFTTIVLGTRAYKARDELRSAQERLLQWVRDGGTLIVQYNKTGDFNAGARAGASPLAPFAASIGDRRVTVEESPVRVKQPEHPLLRVPNVLGDADWRDWVQERATYLLDVKDEQRYVDLLELKDPWPYNDKLHGGALVVAPLGKGRWIYVGLTLFRQLPAGVPGAYRLMANLLARS